MWNFWRRTKKRLVGATLVLGLNALALVISTPLSLHATPSRDMGVAVRILAPPNPITDLTASMVGAQNGDIQLIWTAPRNPNGARINNYYVRYATTPAVQMGSPEIWWSQFPSTEKLISPARAPSILEFTTISGLTVNVSYYFAIKSQDQDGQLSPIDVRAGTANQATSLPLGSDTSVPQPPNNLLGVALSTTGIKWDWDISVNSSFYTLNAFPSGAMITFVPQNTATESGLIANTVYARTVIAGNGLGLSSPSTVQSVYTLAAVPQNFVAGQVNFTDTTLNWQSGGNPNGTQYRLEKSLDGISFAATALITTHTYTDTGLSELTSYYYRLRAINGDGITTTPTPVVTIFTRQQADFIAPVPPAGLKGSLDTSNRAFTLLWEDVATNTDGTNTTDLRGYNIYRRITLRGSGTKITPTPLTSTVFADQVNGQTYYYTVTAIDTTGNESAESLIADSSPDLNTIYLNADGSSSVQMPESVNDLLRSAYNKYGVPLTIDLSEEPIPSDGTIIRSIRLQLKRADTNESVNDLSFGTPNTVVSVGYSTVNGQVVTGAPGANSVNTQGINLAPDKLSLYWFNGVTWVKIGGTLDLLSQALKTKTSFLGTYQLRAAAASTSLTLGQANVYPRLFSPNNDGLNDRVYFVLENPNNAVVTGEIVDLQGRHVRTLPLPNSQAGIGTTMIWDGKDDKGNVVPSGAYIYKITGEGKSFTGTVGVAR